MAARSSGGTAGDWRLASGLPPHKPSADRAERQSLAPASADRIRRHRPPPIRSWFWACEEEGIGDEQAQAHDRGRRVEREVEDREQKALARDRVPNKSVCR